MNHDALPTPAPSILDCVLLSVVWTGTISYLLQNETGMRQDNVYVLGHWEVTVTKGDVQALELMGEPPG